VGELPGLLGGRRHAMTEFGIPNTSPAVEPSVAQQCLQNFGVFARAGSLTAVWYQVRVCGLFFVFVTNNFARCTTVLRELNRTTLGCMPTTDAGDRLSNPCKQWRIIQSEISKKGCNERNAKLNIAPSKRFQKTTHQLIRAANGTHALKFLFSLFVLSVALCCLGFKVCLWLK
jgi:hypothetical protein